MDRAQQTASALGDIADRMAALAAIAEAAADRDPDRATSFADQAEQLTDALISPPARIVAMAEVAALIAGSQSDRATRLADQAEQLARSVPNFETRTRALAQVAVAFARAGQWDQCPCFRDIRPVQAQILLNSAWSLNWRPLSDHTGWCDVDHAKSA